MAGLASRLCERGHSVSLITYESCDDDRHPINSQVERIVLQLSDGGVGIAKRFLRVRQRHRAIASAVQQCQAELLLSFCDRNNIDALAAMKGSGIPVVVCERSDPDQQSLGWYWERARKKLYRSASSVIALTETSAKHLRAYSNHVLVIPSAIEEPPFYSPRETAAQSKTIVSVGRLEPEKGFDRLIRAFASATVDQTDWRLVIYGEGSLRTPLQSLAESLGMDSRVSMPGWVRPIWKPLSEATIFCLSSRYEGFPSALLEAMALGVPSISVDCESGPRAIVRHGENGLLVDPTEEGLATGISRWVHETTERERLGEAGKGVVDEFGWETMVNRYENAIEQAISGSALQSGL